MRVRNVEEARKQAQANANASGEPWVRFYDTSGNVCVERQSTGPKDDTVIVEVFKPQQK